MILLKSELCLQASGMVGVDIESDQCSLAFVKLGHNPSSVNSNCVSSDPLCSDDFGSVTSAPVPWRDQCGAVHQIHFSWRTVVR